MSGSVNKCILLGNLCADPEVRNTQDGRAIVNIRLATNETWKDKNTGERKSKPEFHSITIFNEHIGKIAQEYLKKGSSAYFEGKLQTRKWTDNSGNDRYSTEVVLENFNGQLTLLDSKGSNGGADNSYNGDDDHGSNARNDTYLERDRDQDRSRGSRDDDRGNARGNDRNDNRGRGDSNNGNRGASQDRSGNGGGSRNNDPDRFKKDIDDEIPF